MKYDKETIVVIVICVALLLGWQFIFPYNSGVQQQSAAHAPAKTEAPAAGEAAQGAQPQQVQEDSSKSGAAAAGSEQALKEVPAVPDVSLSNGLADFIIDPNKGAIRDVRLDKFKMASGKEPIVIGLNSLSGAFSLGGLDGWSLVSVDASKLSASSATVTRQYKKGDSALSATQTFTLGDS